MSGYSSAALQGARAHVMCGDCRLLCVTMTRWVALARFRSYVGLLMNSYCHADAAEQTQWFGDDIAFKRDGVEILGMGTVQAVAFLLRGWKRMIEFLTNDSTLAAQFARRLGFDDAVCSAIAQTYRCWDGSGQPYQLRGSQICLATGVGRLQGVWGATTHDDARAEVIVLDTDRQGRW